MPGNPEGLRYETASAEGQTMIRRNAILALAVAILHSVVLAQAPAPQAPLGRGGASQGRPPTHANIDYALPEPSTACRRVTDASFFTSPPHFSHRSTL
jgi:hypothetical protein